jgi:hypothetical protein
VEKTIFTTINEFETSDDRYPGRYSDSVYLHGHKSYELAHQEMYSPFLSADLRKIDLEGVSRAVSSAMILATDSMTTAILVFEVWFTPAARRVDWQQEILTGDKITTGTWTRCSYNYAIPKEFINPNFTLKTYLWNHGKGRFYADDLKLEIIAGR